MTMPPGELFHGIEADPPRRCFQMIMAKDDPAPARQPSYGLFENCVIAFVGEQPQRRQGPTRLVGQMGAGLVSQHKQAYRRSSGERE
ncbi:hypothetical protein SPHINGOR109_50532 [Sphingorhabdus sp. 109]|nr:hypothetical protein SPHINGOR109_50532 [Sphingorhabdus sp. 109]